MIVILLYIAPLQGSAQVADAELLSLEKIFSSPDFFPERLGTVQWLSDGSGYTKFEPSRDIDGGEDVVLYNPESDQRKIIVPAFRLVPEGYENPLPIDDFSWSSDSNILLIYTNSQRVWRQNTRGDYWTLDRITWKLSKLGRGAQPASLMFATLSPLGDKAAYVRENNLYVEDIKDNSKLQLTHDGSDTIINGTFDWVYEEELSLRNGFRWSPDGKTIAFWQLNAEGVEDFYLINTTDSLYPELVPVKYPKAGTINSLGRIGVVESGGGEIRWLDLPGHPRENYVARMEWADNSGEIALQYINRLQNTLNIMTGDISSGEVSTILTEHDEAWIDITENIYWIFGGEKFIWVSERDGWKHAYLITRNGEEQELVTPGNFDLISIQSIDEENGWLYYSASPDNPTQRYLYRASLTGKKVMERISPDNQKGTHSYNISPDSKWAIHTFSSFNKPPVTGLVKLPDHTTMTQLIDNSDLKDKTVRLAIKPGEFFRVEIEDGVELDGWVIQPYKFDPEKKYPLLLYVYGGPAGQTVLDRWSGSRYLWHQMLAQKGYIVMSIDNRGTPAPRGREWRKILYKKLGVMDSDDQASALRNILLKRPYIDPERVGIWGWSGGGTMSLYQIFKYPDLYKTAIAVAPVTDIRLYDTIYQERYMGLPGNNELEYELASPVTFADRLEGNLLIVHGTGDDNVHYQNTEVLVNKLIENNKYFSMMSYPNRTHGIYEGKNTTRHLYELLTRYIYENLPAGY